MTSRNQFPWKNFAPASTTYTLPTTIGREAVVTKKSPIWSFKSRHDFGTARYDEIKKQSPGAAAYSSTDPNITRSKSGVYSIQGRTKPKNSIYNNPGPGSYTPLLAKKGGFSMGVKHSPFSVMCITDIDCK